MEKILKEQTPAEEIIAELKTSALRGRGGAGCGGILGQLGEIGQG